MNQIPDVPIINQECRLLFPFHHYFNDLAEAEGIAKWKPWLKRLDGDDKLEAYDRTLYFQPFVRKMLFPEMDPPMQSHSTRHLAFMPDNRLYSSDFELQPMSNDKAPDGEVFKGSISWIDVYLFHDKMGILVININPECPSLHQLADFLRTARMVLPPYVGFNLPRLSLANFPFEQNINSMNDLINYLLKPMIDPLSIGGKNGNDYTKTPIGKEEGERCWTFTYAQVCDDEHIGNNKTEIPELEMRDLWLYEIGTVTPIRDGYIPANEHIAKIINENRMSVWDSWRGIALRDTITFLEFSDSTKTDKTFFFNNATKDYFFLYIYCLYQKVELLKLQNNLIEAGEISDKKERLHGLLGQLVEFRNHFWFAEVTRKALGGELYRKYQHGLETPILYEYVSSEIHDLYAYFCSVANEEQLNQNRKLNKTIGIIAAVIGIPTMFIGFLGINLRDYNSSEGLSLSGAFVLVLGSIIFGAGVAFLLKWIGDRKVKG
jgi:hypothetical protein